MEWVYSLIVGCEEKKNGQKGWAGGFGMFQPLSQTTMLVALRRGGFDNVGFAIRGSSMLESEGGV